MGKKKFSLTTYVIVGIALVALYFVGKTVTPPPAAPPVEVKPITAQAPATPMADKEKYEEKQVADAAKARRAQQIREMSAHAPTKQQANVPTFNPNSIDTESTTYWQNKSIKDGEKGVQEMTAKVAAAKAKMPPPKAPQLQAPTPVGTSH